MSENNDIKDSTSVNEVYKNNKIILTVSILLIAFVLVFLLVFLPYSKAKKAKEFISNNENEKAIQELYGVLPIFGINNIKESATLNITKDIIKNIQNDHKSFSEDIFSIESIYDFSNRINNNAEDVSFKVNLVNDNCSAILECTAKKTFSDSEWILKEYNIESVNYDISKKCNKEIADEYINNHFPNATFKEESDITTDIYHSFIYETQDISESDPFYYDTKQVKVVCSYDVSENKWSVVDANEKFISAEKIPLKEFITPEYIFLLPESWYMRINGSSNTYEIDGVSKTSGHNNYNWFANKNEAMAYSEKDGGADIFSIYFSYGTDVEEYIPDKKYFSNIETIDVTAFGKGYIYSTTYDTTNYINTAFNSSYNGYKCQITANSRVIDMESMIDILNEIQRKNSQINVEVLVKKLNIREYPGTYSKVVGSTTTGKTYKATEISDDYEGYRWYKIGTNQWIADLDGEYLKVTYN